jgi:hypothetical protein
MQKNIENFINGLDRQTHQSLGCALYWSFFAELGICEDQYWLFRDINGRIKSKTNESQNLYPPTNVLPGHTS